MKYKNYIMIWFVLIITVYSLNGCSVFYCDQRPPLIDNSRFIDFVPVDTNSSALPTDEYIDSVISNMLIETGGY